jgi:hypothetical protein
MINKAEASRLYETYQRLLNKRVWAVYSRTHTDIDEIRSIANEMFCKAVSNYNPDKAAFSTHLWNWLRKVETVIYSERSTDEFDETMHICDAVQSMIDCEVESLSVLQKRFIEFLKTLDIDDVREMKQPSRVIPFRFAEKEGIGKRDAQTLWSELRAWFNGNVHVCSIS